MARTNRKLLSSAITITLIALIFSCQSPLIPAGLASNFPDTPGVLVVQINSSAAKSLLPDIDMKPASYIVTGSGPNGSTFETPPATSSPVVIKNLTYGDWTVTVDALNAAGTVIGRSSQPVVATVHVDQSTTVNISVKPLQGYGTLNLTVIWNTASVENPKINAQLVPTAGSALTLSFGTVKPGTATYSSSTIPTGYHTLVIQLQDGSTVVMGAVESVRIVKDAVTSGSFDFQQVNPASGQITVNITPAMSDPIAVTLAGQVNEIQAGSTMTVTASVPADTGNVVYTWYVNGASKAVGASYTVASILPAGFYRLDVTAFAADGSRAGSASHNFQVNDIQLTQASLIWDPNIEANLAGYKIYYGTSSGNYDSAVDVGNQTAYILSALQVGVTYYISATAYNTSGLESDYSNEVVFSGT
jgi:hypothetical protein